MYFLQNMNPEGVHTDQFSRTVSKCPNSKPKRCHVLYSVIISLLPENNSATQAEEKDAPHANFTHLLLSLLQLHL
jgi:hypothetical protein